MTELISLVVDLGEKIMRDAKIRRWLATDAPACLKSLGLGHSQCPSKLEISANIPSYARFDDVLNDEGPECRLSTKYDSEFLLVIMRKKELCYIIEDEIISRKYAKEANNAGFYAILTPFAYNSNKTAKEGLSDLSELVQVRGASDNNRMRGVIIARNEIEACLGWLCTIFHWNEFLGRLLGYPECCIEHFGKHWPEAVTRHKGNMIRYTMANSKGYSFPSSTNFFLRYFGYYSLQHFPCSLECRRSRSLGNLRASLISDIPESIMKQLTFSRSRAYEMCGVLCADGFGLALFPEFNLRRVNEEWILSYDQSKVRCSDPNGRLDTWIRSSAVICGVVSNDRLLLDRKIENTWFVVFK